MKTFTPDLDPAALERLREYAARFAPDFPQSKPARWAGVYLHGLLADGERKSIEPLSRRDSRPPSANGRRPGGRPCIGRAYPQMASERAPSPCPGASPPRLIWRAVIPS